MKIPVLVVTLATVVLARPDISHVLQIPATSYGVPSASVTNSPLGIPSGSYLPGAPQPTFQTPVISTPVPFYTGNTQFIVPTYHGASGISSISSSSNHEHSAYNTQYSSQSHAQHVQKHVYFYEAPEETYEQPHVRIPVEPPKKNIKIIFIKAPTYPVPTYPTIPLQPQNEEKTLVYVLVKKPEEPSQVYVPTPQPTEPAKPEVYFIKYRNQQEAQDKVSNTLTEHSNSGANIITNTVDTAHVAGSDDAGISGAAFGSSGSLAGVGINEVVQNGGSLSSSTFDSGSLSGLNQVQTSGLSTGALGSLSGVGINEVIHGADHSGGYSYGGNAGIDVSVTGNGLSGQYVSSTVPTIISSTGYDSGLSGHYISSTVPSIISSTGFDSSTIASVTPSSISSLNIGNVPYHPTYGPPGESGPY